LHRRTTETYPWFGELIGQISLLNNDKVASRIARNFTRDIALLPPMQQGLMRETLLKLQASDIKLGPAAKQVIERALKLIEPNGNRPTPKPGPIVA